MASNEVVPGPAKVEIREKAEISIIICVSRPVDQIIMYKYGIIQD